MVKRTPTEFTDVTTKHQTKFLLSTRVKLKITAYVCLLLQLNHQLMPVSANAGSGIFSTISTIHGWIFWHSATNKTGLNPKQRISTTVLVNCQLASGCCEMNIFQKKPHDVQITYSFNMHTCQNTWPAEHRVRGTSTFLNVMTCIINYDRFYTNKIKRTKKKNMSMNANWRSSLTTRWCYKTCISLMTSHPPIHRRIWIHIKPFHTMFVAMIYNTFIRKRQKQENKLISPYISTDINCETSHIQPA